MLLAKVGLEAATRRNVIDIIPCSLKEFLCMNHLLFGERGLGAELSKENAAAIAPGGEDDVEITGGDGLTEAHGADFRHIDAIMCGFKCLVASSLDNSAGLHKILLQTPQFAEDKLKFLIVGRGIRYAWRDTVYSTAHE